MRKKKLHPYSVEAFNNAGMQIKMKREIFDAWNKSSFEEKVKAIENRHEKPPYIL